MISILNYSSTNLKIELYVKFNNTNTNTNNNKLKPRPKVPFEIKNCPTLI